MHLSVETIAAHQDLLLTSLPDRLAPRWQLLSRLASEQAAFKAEHHLTALATLSDQDFSCKFCAEGDFQSLACPMAAVFYMLTSTLVLCLSFNKQCHVVLGMHLSKMYSDTMDPLAHVSGSM